MFHFNTLEKFENISIGWRFKYFHDDSKPSDNCIVLGIDASGIEKYGHWPWDRKVHAELLDALDFYGVKSASFDIFFPFRNKEKNEDQVKYVKSDLEFVQAVNNFQNNNRNLTLATVITMEKDPYYYDKEDKTIFENLKIKTNNKIQYVDAISLCEENSPEEIKELDLYLYFQKPFSELFKIIKSIGLVNIYTRKKEVIEIPLFVKQDNLIIANLGFETYLNSLKSYNIRQNDNSIYINNEKVPTLANNNYMVNWYQAKANNTYPYEVNSIAKITDAYEYAIKKSKELNITKEEFQYNVEKLYLCYKNKTQCSEELIEFENILPDDAPFILRKNLENKYVFIGMIDSTSGYNDMIKTPLFMTIPGVFLHVNVFDNFQQGNFLSKTTRITTLLVMFVLVIFCSLSVLSVKDPRVSMGIGLIYWFYALIPLLLFKYCSIVADFTYTEIAIVVTYFVAIGYQWKVSDQDKQLLKNTFSNYLAPQILNEILSDPSKIELGGESREITILFSDIRGFTSISEKNSPKQIVAFLNEYFNAMVEAIMKNEGTVDKFIGDAIMAFWGAPVKNDKHAELAIKGALDMAEALDKLKAKWAEGGKDYPEIDIGVGINTGEAIFGNVGSEKTRSYTVIGDSVNLASRLEGLNKKYAISDKKKRSIIISEYTYEKVKDIFDVEYLGEDTVKGKTVPVKLYRVLNVKEK